MSLTLGTSKKKMTMEEVRLEMIRVSNQVIFDNLDEAIEIALAVVALKDGPMSVAIKNVLIRKAESQRGRALIILEMNVDEISEIVPYTRDHWGTSPSGNLFYFDPTTPGTAPINPLELLITIANFIQPLILGKLKSLGYVR